MHSISYLEMEKNLLHYLNTRKLYRILEVGSRSKSMSYRPIVEECRWEYDGIDLKKGPNVDHTMEDTYTTGFVSGTFDVILSGQCFEHVANPFKLMEGLAYILKPGGWMFHVAPFVHPKHDKFDAWRFLPHAWKTLFQHAGIKTIKTYIVEADEIISGYNGENPTLRKGHFADCWGIGRKI